MPATGSADRRGGREAGTSHPHEHGLPQTARARQRRRLTLALVLSAVYMLAEVAGGFLSNSLALLADAGHMLADVAALGLSLFAFWAAQRPATPKRTYGFHRMEILAALANGATLVAIALLIFVEAYRRWAHPPQVRGGLMLAVACGGLVVNLASLLILHGGRAESLNVRGAWLHVATDTLGSVQAIAAGALISGLRWYWADPLASILIGILVIFSSWGLLRESVGVLMEGVPPNLELDEVAAVVAGVPGIRAVHDLHVWTITSGFVALSAHVVVPPETPEDILWRVRAALHDRFGIEHSTIQVERMPEVRPPNTPPAAGVPSRSSDGKPE
jgi:cobalt-zinc-cadmium efflux system protein